jgi:hypothetical protein
MAGNASRGADRSGFLSKWGPAITIAISLLGGYGILYLAVIDGVKDAVATNERRIDGREAVDRDIRAVIRGTNEAIRAEISKLGDRLVASNQDVIEQINKMRGELVATMKEGDDRLERRFDRLDEKFDTLLTKIDYEVIEIPWDQAPITVRKDGALFGQDGKELGTIPAVLRFGQP